MAKSIKKILSLCCVFTFLLISSASAANSINIEYAPQSSSQEVGIANTTYTFDLNKSTGRVDYEASVMGTSGVTQSSVSANIQRYVGGSWTDVPGSYVIDTQNSNSASFQRSFYVEKGYLYRMQALYVCYIGSTKYTKTVNTSASSYT